MVALIILFAFFVLEICKQCRRKLEEASLLAFPNSESEEALKPLGEPNVAEPVERISEDITQVCNIAITVTELLKHELNFVVRVDFEVKLCKTI